MTITANDLLSRLQSFQRKSAVFKAIFEAEANGINARELVIDDLMLQLSVDTATWGLSYYEHDLGIPIDNSKSYEDRRAVVKSKMRGVGTVNAALIKNVANAFTGGNIDVGFNNGTINITFTDTIGTPPNIEDFKKAIEEIKPAHLLVLYNFLFNRYEQFTGYTYAQLTAKTYEQLRSSTLP